MLFVASLPWPYTSGDMMMLVGHLQKFCFDVTKISSSIPLDNQMSNLSCCDDRTLILNRPDMSLSGRQHITDKLI